MAKNERWRMRMSYGYLVISPEAQKLIEEGRARLEKANVVWNPGSGNTGVFEWAKFVEVDEDELKNNDVKMLASGVVAGAIAAAGIAGVVVYNISRKQDERDKKVNNLISCLSTYTLELCDNNVRQSTVLDLKVAIREFMSDKKLLKKVDETLLKNLSITISHLKEDDKDQINDRIIDLQTYIQSKSKSRSKSFFKKTV
ncbi:hypothetical protein [Streptococcus salivarius]|uniref:hypothetical protein n=1 Tax=Streptococcus salivarius TaxID=1304 RepID=UPI0022E52CCD|nr:hypothetical protein [Streptococcus salivarius]